MGYALKAETLDGINTTLPESEPTVETSPLPTLENSVRQVLDIPVECKDCRHVG